MDTQLKQLCDAAATYSQFPDQYIQSLARSHELRHNLLIDVIGHLDFPLNSHGLDAGCGIGLPACTMAVVRPDLKLTCIDASRDLLNVAEDIALRAGVQENILFEQVDILEPLFPDEAFDWVFSMDCLNYAPELGIEALKHAKRMLKKGGKITLLGWSSQQILPGFPIIEARLNATQEGIAPFNERMDPDRHFLRSGKTLADLGFGQIKPQSFVQNINPPLSQDQMLALRDLVRMRWPDPSGPLPQKDQAVFERIMDEHSNQYILADPYYYGFFTYTLFSAQKGF